MNAIQLKFRIERFFIGMKAVFRGTVGASRVFRSRAGRTCHYEWPSPFAQIDQCEHRERAVGILGLSRR